MSERPEDPREQPLQDDDGPIGPFGPSSNDPLDEAPAPASYEPPLAGPGGLPRDPMPAEVPPSPSEGPPATSEAPSRGGLWGSGDPLAGATQPTTQTQPGTGYTSPPPPGAGGPSPASLPGTPGAMAGRYTLASWGSRVIAQLVDGLIIGVGALILFFIFTAIFSVGFAAGDETGFAAIVVGLILWSISVAIVALVYAPTLMARTNGQTIGRKVAGIRVVRTSGEPITFGFAVMREVVVKALGVGFLASLSAGIFYFIDVLWPLWDEENRALHDFVVNTRTVKT